MIVTKLIGMSSTMVLFSFYTLNDSGSAGKNWAIDIYMTQEKARLLWELSVCEITTHKKYESMKFFDATEGFEEQS